MSCQETISSIIVPIIRVGRVSATAAGLSPGLLGGGDGGGDVIAGGGQL